MLEAGAKSEVDASPDPGCRQGPRTADDFGKLLTETIDIDQRQSVGSSTLAASLALAVLLFAFALPTIIDIARLKWSTEEGAHAPIVLFTGVWLLYRLWPQATAHASRPASSHVWLIIIALLPLYLFARATSIVEIEGYIMYAALLAVLYSLIGISGIKQVWFPLFYIAFVLPIPDTILAAITNPLKIYISQISVAVLDAMGLPIGLSGVRIYIGQYELLVAAACSGLNSLISLSAISLFYVYIRHKADWRYALLLGLMSVPIALLANLIRVIILILLTYYAGEAAAQGFLHNFAGLVMFALAMILIFGVDEMLQRIRDRRSPNEKTLDV